MFSKQAEVYTRYHFNKYSLDLFESLRSFILKNKIRSHHDLACGVGDFVNRMNGLKIDSAGSDISKEMILLAKKRFPKFSFTVQDMSNFQLEKSVDLITINYFAINILLYWKQWQQVFENVFLSLNERGYFIFDMASVGFIKNAQIVSHRKIGRDYLLEDIKSEGKVCKFELTWFQEMEERVFKKKNESYYETSFRFEKVKKELLNTGFNDVTFLIFFSIGLLKGEISFHEVRPNKTYIANYSYR